MCIHGISLVASDSCRNSVGVEKAPVCPILLPHHCSEGQESKALQSLQCDLLRNGGLQSIPWHSSGHGGVTVPSRDLAEDTVNIRPRSGLFFMPRNRSGLHGKPGPGQRGTSWSWSLQIWLHLLDTHISQGLCLQETWSGTREVCSWPPHQLSTSPQSGRSSWTLIQGSWRTSREQLSPGSPVSFASPSLLLQELDGVSSPAC